MFNFKFRAIACLVVAAFLIENCAAAAGMTAPQWSSVLPQKNSGTSEQDLQVSADLAIIKSDKNYSSDLKIISIEDAHSSIDAQKKIAELLHELVSRYQLSMVGLEGSRGVLDTALLSSFPHQESKKQVAESMLRNTQINAGEFFKIFYDESQVELFGIEDESLYAGNIEAYQKLLSLQDPVRDELSKINDLLTNLRPRVFSSEILSFVVAQKKFEEANLDFSEYWEIVRNYVRNSGITLEKYPNVLKLSRTSELESEIDFEKANAERDQLMREMKDKADNDTLAQLTEMNFLFKKGKITPGLFHANLAISAKRYGLDPSEYTDLILYTRYALEYESIDLLSVFGELADLNSVIFSQMKVTPEQKEFWELEKSVRIFSHFLEAKISSPDKKYYTENISKFDTRYLQRVTDHLSKQYGIETAGIDWKILNQSLSNSVQFYRDVEARDAALLRNLTQRMIEKNIKVACLVAGGFHSEGLSDLMSQGRISHMVVMPSFDSKEGDRPYLTVITDKGSFLEQKLRTEAQLEAMSLLMASAVNSGVNLRNALPQYAQAFWEESHKQNTAGQNWEAYLNTKSINLKEGVKFRIIVEKNSPRIISSEKLSEPDARRILDEEEYVGDIDPAYKLISSAKNSSSQQNVYQTIRDASEKFKAKLAVADSASRLKKSWKSEWDRHLNLEMRKQGILWNPQQITGAEKTVLEEAERGIEIAVRRSNGGQDAAVATKSALSGISVAASRLAIEGAKVKRTGVGEYEVALPVYEISDRPSEDVSIEESLEQLRQVYAGRIKEAILSYTIQDVRSNNVRASVEENIRGFIASNFPSMSALEVKALLSRPDVRTVFNEKIDELERLDVAGFLGVGLDELMIPGQDGRVDADKQTPVRQQSERKKPSIWTWSYWSNLLGLKAAPRARRSSYSYSSRIAAVEVLPPRTMLTATGLAEFNLADNLDVLHNDTSTQVEVRYVDTQSFEFADNSKLTPDDRVVIQVDQPDGRTRTLSETSADDFFTKSGGYAEYTFDLTPELGQEVSLSVAVKDGEDSSDVIPPIAIASGIRVEHTGPTLPPTAQVFDEGAFEIAHFDDSNDIGIFVDNSEIQDDIELIARSIAANDAGLAQKSNQDLVDQVSEQTGLRFFAAPDRSQDSVGPQIVIPLGDAKTASDTGADTMLVTLSDLPVTGQPYDVYVQLVGEGLSGDDSVLQIADNVTVTTDEASIRSFPDAAGTFRVSADPETAGSFVISTNTDAVTAFTADSSNIPDQATPNAAVRFVITDFAAPGESPVQTLTELAVVPVSDFQGSTGTVNSAAYYPDLSGTYTISAQMVAPGWKPSEPQTVSSVTVQTSFVDQFVQAVSDSDKHDEINQLIQNVYNINILRPGGLTADEINRIQPAGDGTESGASSAGPILYVDTGNVSNTVRFFEYYLNLKNQFSSLSDTDKTSFTSTSTAIDPAFNLNNPIGNEDTLKAVASVRFNAEGQQADTTVLVEAYIQAGETFAAYQNILNASEKASADWVLNALAGPKGLNVNLSNGLQQDAAEQDVEGLLAIGMTPEGLVVFSLAREQLVENGNGSENDIAAVQALAQRVFDLDAGFSAADRSSLAVQFSIPVNQQVLTNKTYVKALLQAATNSGGGGVVFFSGSSLTLSPGTAAGGIGFGSSAGYGGSDPVRNFPNDRPEVQIYRSIDRLQGLIREGDLDWKIIREQPDGPGGKTIYKLQIKKDSFLGDVIIAESADNLLFDATINTVEHYFITILQVTKDGQFVGNRLLIIDIDPDTGKLKIVGDFTGDISEFEPRLEYDRDGNIIAIHFTINGEEKTFAVRQNPEPKVPEVEPPVIVDTDALLREFSEKGLPEAVLKSETDKPTVAAEPESEAAKPAEVSEKAAPSDDSAAADAEDEKPKDESVARTSILLFVLAAVASVFTRAFLKKQKKTEISQAQPVQENRIRRIIRSIFGLSILFIVLSANGLYPTQLSAQEAVVAPIVDLQSEARGIVDEIRILQAQETSNYQSYLQAKEAYEQNREGYRYTRNKYVTLMQVSWNAVGGTRNESEVHEPLVDSQGRKIAARKGRYRFPVGSQGRFDKIDWYRYFTIGAPDKSGHQGEIVGRYKLFSQLPEAAQTALRDSPAPYYAPNGAAFAQFFNASLVGRDGVTKVGFRFNGVNQDGTYKVETVPAQWGADHPKEMDLIRKFGIGAPVFVEARAITKARYEKLKAAIAEYPELGVSTYYDKDSGVYYEVSSGQDGRWNRLGSFFLQTESGIDFSLQLIRGTHTTFGGINEDAHLAAEEMEALARKGGVIRARPDVFGEPNGGLAPLQVVTWSDDKTTENYRLIQEVLEKQTKERYRLVALILEAQKRNDEAEEERLLKLAENLSDKGWWLDADGYMYTIWTPLSTVYEEGQEIFSQIEKIAERSARLKATKAGRLERLEAIREQLKKGGARLPVESLGAVRMLSADPISSMVVIPAILFGVIVMKQNRPGARLSEETIAAVDFTKLADKISLSDRLVVVGNLELKDLSPDQAAETALNFISRLNASAAGVGAASSLQKVITLDVAASGIEAEVLESYKSAIEKRAGDQTQIIITNNVVAVAYEQADRVGAQPVVIEFSAKDSLLKIDSKILSAYELHLARRTVKLDAVQQAVYRQIEAAYKTVADTAERERLIARHKFEFSALLLSDFGVFSSATAQFLKDQAVEQEVLLRAFAGQFDGINVPTSVTAVLDYTTFSQLQSLNPTLDGQMIQQRMLKEQTGADSRIVWLFKDETQRQEALGRPDLRLNIRDSVVSSAEETAGIIEAAKAQGIAIGPNEEAIVIQLTSPERKLSRSESSDVYVLEVEPDLKTDSTGFFLLRGYDISILKERIKTEAVPGIEVFVDENGRLSIKLKAVKIDWNSIMTTLRLSITATSIAA